MSIRIRDRNVEGDPPKELEDIFWLAVVPDYGSQRAE
jgi:hypothetical protein